MGAGGDLRVEQSSGSHSSHAQTKNEWALSLNDDIPTDVSAELGAGEATINLGSVVLRSLRIEMGGGTLNMDLRGNPKRSYDVTIRGGAGNAIVHLPAGVGLYAAA